MIIFLDSDGSIVSSQTGNVGNGSSVAWIYAIAPIAAATASISFELPTGDYTEDFIMTLNSAVTNNQTSELPEGVLNAWAPNGTINYWACKLDKSITGYSGTVKYTIRFTFPSGDVLTSSGGSFEVARGTPSLPSTPSNSVYSQILTALASVSAANNENTSTISDLRTKLEALGVRVARLETGEGDEDSGDGTQRGVAIYATTSFPDASLTPDVKEGDLCICVYQAATGIYQYNNADGWRYFVGLGDGRVVVNNYAPSSGYQLQNGDVWIDTSTSTLYYSNDGSSISSVSIGSPVARYSDVNPSTFDWGTFIGTTTWYSAPNQGVGLFTFASGCAPTFDGTAYNGSLFMVVNADITKGIYFTTFMNGKTYVASYPAVSNTISVPAALAFSAASGSGGTSYTTVSDILSFDWMAAMCTALGVDSLTTENNYIQCGQLFVNFPNYVASLPDNNYLGQVILDFNVAYRGQGFYEMTLIANYKGKSVICTAQYELQNDSSYGWNFGTGGRPYVSFSYVT